MPGTASVFGRTGAVAAQSSEYTFSQIGGTAGKSQLPWSAMYTDLLLASSGLASAAANWLGFDSTANKWHIWDGQDGTLPVLHASDAVLIQGGVQPATPPSGQAALYMNSADKKIHSTVDTAYGERWRRWRQQGRRQPLPETRPIIRFTQPPSTRFRLAGA